LDRGRLTTGRGRQDRAGKGGLPQKRVFLYPLAPAALKRLCGQPAPPLPGWVHREFSGAKLGDRRLAGRLLRLAGAFFAVTLPPPLAKPDRDIRARICVAGFEINSPGRA
jgi:hypothetical protein